MNKTLKIILIVFAIFFLLCLCTSVGGYFLIKSGKIKLPENSILDFIVDPDEEAAEELAEDLIENSSDEDVDVEFDEDDDSISVETEDGSYYAGSADEWPNDIPNDFPEFTNGTVTYASKIDSDENVSWSVMFDSVATGYIDTYKTTLQDDGFEIETEATYNDVKSLSAVKDQFSVYLSLDGETEELTITLYQEK